MRVLSWNIQWGRGIDGRVDLARTAAVIRGCDADVVCLQEVAVNHPGLPGGAGEDQVARLCALLPGHAAVFAAGSDLPDGKGGRRFFGELILSRLPLLQVFRHLLPWPADPAVPSMQRVAVEAVIDAPFGPLRVVTTHLEYYSALQRAAQVEFLRDLQATAHRHAVAPRSNAETDPPFAVLPRGEFSVFCGDFNCPAGSSEHARMQAAIAPDVPRLVDAWSIAHPGVSPAPTFGVHDRGFLAAPAAYDFCFVSDNLAPRVAGLDVDVLTPASDHQPVLLTLA
ncbi:endonuclease/exonuclease/phosphatase family protein [Sulfurisoma sediminicola]|uniref:Endonuclease/exonuclease/phosphatase family metal-dependent hydrolase n=1 Tax=Sulfurisoma sediminicola TaxID=1381557 RepID=A0A497X833_9PROT|nr:endonuclease/exonuclease/phosphatase family protein [Sulfurisoma sediminicola]RLJ61655.1 endonuclease/exonuclease/phosphatase family metal-dependent hydrolase [Sulfurisoma sediminicola]